ncbi:hypothetical protein CLOM_g16307 [Closterium sp. NIES-68]|nr:hypothetical protein CLOM_g16307 [Closterium sp. NIES-68]GJP70454.1 hypothetical protein CLOP_g1398 [Closterium sp. NIES-67]
MQLDWSLFVREKGAMLPVLRHIPFRRRALTVACVRPLLRKLKEDPKHLAAGTLLGVFPQLCLSTAAIFGDVGHWKQVRGLLHLFKRGEWSTLYERGLASINTVASRVRTSRAGTGPEDARTRRSIQFAQIAELSRAAEALVAAELAPATKETLLALEAKHPDSNLPRIDEEGKCILASPAKPTKWTLKTKVLLRALRESPRGSAGGPTGWRMDFLREMFTHPDDIRLLGGWLQHAARGEVGPGIATLWTASTLVALAKPGGGVRPIAVGEVFPHLVARCFSIDFHDVITRHLQPKGQFGAGARFGGETMIHGIRAGRRANPEWVILQIDVANAFNTICRIVLFDELVKGPFAPMVPFLLSLYGAPSSLLYRADTTRHTLWSRTGVRQGDPLGSFLYALAQQPALERMKAQHLDVFVVSYADDTYVMGDIKAVGKAYTTLQSELECSGMQTSVVKCEWYSPSGPQPTQGNPLYSMEEVKDGLVVVGSPVGGSAFVEAAVKAKRGSDEPVLAALPGIGDAQTASRILAGSVLARSNFICRTTPPTPKLLEALKAWDTSLVTCFSKILDDESLMTGGKVNEAARLQISLPERLGGFGIQSAARMADLAYVVSLLSVAGNLWSFFQIGGKSILASFPKRMCSHRSLRRLERHCRVYQRSSGRNSHRGMRWGRRPWRVAPSRFWLVSFRLR